MKTLCSHIMVENPVTLQPDCTFTQALLTARQHGVRYLPVVDTNQEFLGLFSPFILLNQLLPKALFINIGKKPVDLNFMRTSMGNLQEKLGNINHQPIGEHLITDVPTCHADSSIMEAIHILHDRHTPVIITDKKSKRLVGIITITMLIDHLTSPNLEPESEY